MVYLLLVVVALAVTELGFQLGRYWKGHFDKVPDTSSSSGIIAATLGLLAFMLAFTTSIALSRYDNRRALVLEEANTIGTTFLRAGYLEEPAATQSQTLLREYVDVRLGAVVPGQFDESLVRSEEIQSELWSIAESLAEAHPDSPLLAIYIESLNSLIDVHSKRLTAVEVSRVPESLVIEIMLITVLVLFLIGLNHGIEGKRNLLAVIVLILVFSMVVLIIIDLDRPQSGFLKVSQQALIDLQRTLNPPAP